MTEQENMETENPSVEEDLATGSQENQTFSQSDLDKIVKERLDRERKKYERKYEGIDVDRYRQLMEQQEQEQMEQQKARGEFESLLKSTVEKKDSQINDLRNELVSIKVDGSLLNAASAKKAINPQQVVNLLKGNIRLGDHGEPEIVDENGSVRYTDQGTAMTPDQLVEEFLTTNPHFLSAGPSGSGAQSAIANSTKVGGVDVNSLDMNNPADRKIYQDYMRSKGIRL